MGLGLCAGCVCLVSGKDGNGDSGPAWEVALWRGLGGVRTPRNNQSGWIMGSLRPALMDCCEEKGMKEVRKKRRARKGKRTKKELCKVKNSSLFFRPPSLRTRKISPFERSDFRGSLQFC